MKASKRAEIAEKKAHHWHQGSGIHASACQSIAEYLEELCGESDSDKKTLKAAELWADAAEAEASLLQEYEGEAFWDNYNKWKHTKSGKATVKAEKATKKICPDFKLSDWM